MKKLVTRREFGATAIATIAASTLPAPYLSSAEKKYGPGASDTDDMWYDATRKRIYVPSGEGFMYCYQQIDADHYKRLAKIPTAIGARTSAYAGQVGKHNSLYLAVPARVFKGAELWVYETRD